MRGRCLAATILLSLALGSGPIPVAAEEGWHSRWVGQSDYLTMQPGQASTFWIRFRNTGTQAWTRGVWGRQVNLALNGDDKAPFRSGMACDWLWDDRIATTAEAFVRPGEVAQFNFCVRAPTVPGTYYLNLRPVVDGTTWLEDEGVYWVIVVAPRRVVSVVDVGGGRDESGQLFGGYGYGALLRNESTTEAVRSVTVSFTFYDTAGLVLGTDRDTVDMLAPRELTGVAGRAFGLSAELAARVARVSAVAGTTDWSWSGSASSAALSFTNPAFLRDAYSSKATATLRNGSPESLSYVTVYVIGRDAAGRIAGGGSATAVAVPAGASVGVQATYYGRRPESLSWHATAALRAPGAMPLRQVTVVEVGGARDESGQLFGGGYGYGAIVRNESPTESVRSVTVSFTFYDASEVVLGTERETVAVLAPRETTGVGGRAFVLASDLAARVTRVAAVVGTTEWSWVSAAPSGALDFAGAAFVADRYSAKATATMRNPSRETFSYVNVFVIGRDAAGRIVGGGSTSAVTVPAGASLGVEAVYYGLRPHTLTFYATASNRSLF